jgi:hypothetical protein
LHLDNGGVEVAHITVSDKNMQHLLWRAKERFNKDEGLARSHIERIISVLEKEAPDDWRFTRSPVAKFLILDTETGFRILGRSYRDVGKEIIERLRNPILDTQTLNELADEYLMYIGTPNARIVHELKTIYKTGQDISELKHSYRITVRELMHIIPLDAKKIASRPNAVVDGDELWVRQKELLSSENPEQEYLFLERLTRQGIDKSLVRIYMHDENGNVKHLEGEDFPIPYNHPFSKGHGLSIRFRSESYWCLPTYVDAYYMDLEYRQRVAPEEITGRETLLTFRIDLIRNRLKERLGVS